MANFCDFEIKVLGTRKAAKLVVMSMPSLEECDITYENGSEKKYELFFTGSCKWSVNFGVKDEGYFCNINGIDEADLYDECEKAYDYSLRAKSEALKCEILVHYWSEESGFDQFDHYVNGVCKKQLKIAYSGGNIFDWDALEFVGHEGEYDEGVNGEEEDIDFLNTLMNAAVMLGGNAKNQINVKKNKRKDGDDPFLACGYNFNYNNNNKFENSIYSFVFPDEFKIYKGEDGRDFVAYYPSKKKPTITIFANNNQIVPITAQLFNNADINKNGLYTAVGSVFAEKMYLQSIDMLNNMALSLNTESPLIFSGSFNSEYAWYGYSMFSSDNTYFEYINLENGEYNKMVRFDIVNSKNDADTIRDVCFKLLEKYSYKKNKYKEPKLNALEFIEKKFTKTMLDKWTKVYDICSNQKNIIFNIYSENIDVKIENYEEATSIADDIKFFVNRFGEFKAKQINQMLELLEKQILLKCDKGYIDVIKEKITAELDEFPVVINLDGKAIESYISRKEFDERLTQILSGNCSSNETPKTEIVKKKKDEEQKIPKKANDAQNKIREEELRKKREIEEKVNRQEQEKKQYEKDLATWKKKCASIETERETIVSEMIKSERNRIEKEALEDKTSKINKVQSEIDDYTKKKQEAELALVSLGFFKIGKKNEQKSIIDMCNSKLTELQNTITSIENKYQQILSTSLQEAKTKEAKYTLEILRKKPLPKEPVRPAFMPAQKEERRPALGNELLKEAILDQLADGGFYTISDLIDSVPELEDESNTKVSALIRGLIDDGKVERTEIRRVAHFSIK